MISFNFQEHEQAAKQFLMEVADELGAPEDLGHAGRVLQAVFYTLRDRITPQESLNLIAQLPLLIKAAYIDGWKISGDVKRLKTKEDFLLDVQKQLPRTEERDLGNIENTYINVECVFHVLSQHIPEGELRDIKSQLPDSIAEMLEV